MCVVGWKSTEDENDIIWAICGGWPGTVDPPQGPPVPPVPVMLKSLFWASISRRSQPALPIDSTMIISQSDEEMVERRVVIFVKAKYKPEQSQRESMQRFETSFSICCELCSAATQW